MKKRTPKPERPWESVDVTIENVWPSVFHGFQKTCEDKGLNEGIVISQLMKAWVFEQYNAPPIDDDVGPDLSNKAHAYIENYNNELWDEFKKNKEEIKNENTSTGPEGMG